MDARWRKFFDGADADIWTVIDYALELAALDFPHELRMRRDGFVEKLFAHPSLLLQINGFLPTVDHQYNEGTTAVDKIIDPPEYDLDPPEYDLDHVRNDISDDEERQPGSTYEYDEAEALTDAMEEESRQMQEIISIKESIADTSQEAEELLVSLGRLEEMHISVESLKATEIGKGVNALRKHGSRRIRSLAKALVRGWKDLVDEWVKSAGDVAAAAMAAGSGSRGEDYGDDGLPSPPLDPGGLLAATRTASLEMSQFFDDFLDGDLSTGSGPSPPSSNGISEDLPLSLSKREQQSTRVRASSPDSRAPRAKGRVVTSSSHLEARTGEGRPVLPPNGHRAADMANSSDRTANGISRGNSGPERTVDRSLPPKVSNGVVRKFDAKPPAAPGNKSKVENGKPREFQEDTSEAARLEAAKRRLHERYQLHETAKRQRVVQVMELTELPKGGPNRARVNQAHAKPTAQSRSGQQTRR